MPQNVICLDNDWKVKDFGFTEEDNLSKDLTLDNTWICAKVPGDIHIDLFNSGRIKDPYYADNSKDCGWVAEKDWYYYKTFKVPEGFTGDKIKLEFEGIDTYSDIWLNGTKLGSTDNMFMKYLFDVSDILNMKTENTLVVRVKSIKKMMEKYSYQKYFACFNTARVFVRKAQCHFGWDWAPELPAAGIWQSVKVVSYVEGHLENVRIHTKNDGRVSFFIKVDRKPKIDELAQSKEEIIAEKIEDELLVQVGDGEVLQEKRIGIRGGKNHLTFEIENPRLWWPNGYGEPNLYNYSVKLLRNGIEVDRKEGRFGIREVELIQEPLKEGGFGFQFHINKTPVYCKGANWVPLDCFTGTIKDEKYINMIKLAKNANFNMLRVWGGGIYEKDIFYELCDENGIMVWQDFMFACSDVPDDDPMFIERVIPEIEYQVGRLLNHAGIVFWCGGNEKTGSEGMKKSYGDKIFHYIIRGVCNHLDGTRPYGAASPQSFSDLGNDGDSGDTHCNCLEKSFKRGMTVFRQEIEKIDAVFNSECAIQGPTRYQSMLRFMPAEKLWPLNDLWRFRYKDNPYNSLVEEYLDIQKAGSDILFGESGDVKEFLKKAMTMHYEILKAEIERQRVRKWANSGFMFWMYSDIWPTGTWAVVDYYQLPKPAYYAVKKAYEPFMLSIQELKGEFRLFVSNDLLKRVTGKLEYGQATVNGELLWKDEINGFSINENESVEAVNIGRCVKDVDDSYLFARFAGEEIKVNTTFFKNLWKDIVWKEPGLKAEVLSESKKEDYYVKVIELSAHMYARMVNVSLQEEADASFSDNFFDMEAGEKKHVTISSKCDFVCSSLRIDHWLTEWI